MHKYLTKIVCRRPIFSQVDTTLVRELKTAGYTADAVSHWEAIPDKLIILDTLIEPGPKYFAAIERAFDSMYTGTNFKVLSMELI